MNNFMDLDTIYGQFNGVRFYLWTILQSQILFEDNFMELDSIYGNFIEFDTI